MSLRQHQHGEPLLATSKDMELVKTITPGYSGSLNIVSYSFREQANKSMREKEREREKRRILADKPNLIPT